MTRRAGPRGERGRRPARDEPVSCHGPALALARRHPRGGAAAQRDVADALARPRHCPRVLSPAAVEEPAGWVAIAVVRQADRGVDHALEGGPHPRDLGVRQRVRAPPGIEARLVQHLVGDPVADPGREALIEQQRLERCPALPHEIAEGREGRQGPMRVEAEQADGRLVGWIVAQADPTETTRVGDDELAAVVEDELELREARGPRAVRAPRARLEPHARASGRRVEAARHAEVQAWPRPAIQLEPEMLAVTLHGKDATAHEGLAESRGGHPLEHDGVVGAAGLGDASAERHLHGDAPAALDLGELGHGAEHTVAGGWGAAVCSSPPAPGFRTMSAAARRYRASCGGPACPMGSETMSKTRLFQSIKSLDRKAVAALLEAQPGLKLVK